MLSNPPERTLMQMHLRGNALQVQLQTLSCFLSVLCPTVHGSGLLDNIGQWCALVENLLRGVSTLVFLTRRRMLDGLGKKDSALL